MATLLIWILSLVVLSPAHADALNTADEEGIKSGSAGGSGGV